jgi:hypothetical protein
VPGGVSVDQNGLVTIDDTVCKASVTARDTCGVSDTLEIRVSDKGYFGAQPATPETYCYDGSCGYAGDVMCHLGAYEQYIGMLASTGVDCCGTNRCGPGKMQSWYIDAWICTP